MNGASTLGRLTMSAFGDRTGPLNMHYVATAISSLLILILWTLTKSLTSAIAFCVLFGAFSGAVIGLPPASISNILKHSYVTMDTIEYKTSKLGQWTGMMYTAAAIPSLAGPIIAGHLVSQYNTYITVQMWSGVNLAISAMCMFVARRYLPSLPEDYQQVEAMAKREANRISQLRLIDSTLSMSHSMTADTRDTRVSNEKINEPEPSYHRGAPDVGRAV